MSSPKDINGLENEKQFEGQKTEYKREKWANKTEFILSSLGYAIGIGNVWRFPYLCYRSGGGAFLIPYLLMLFFCGVPLYFLETSLGQFSSGGCLTVFNMAPLFKDGQDAEIYRNSKGYFSVNTQVIGDSDLRIRDIVARWPGSANDSTIFNNSRVRATLESGHFHNCLMLGAGVAMIMVNLIVTTYFVTLYAYPLLFLFYSFQEELPWSHCNNPWNTDACVKLEGSFSALDANFLSKMNMSSRSGVKTSSEEFFNNEILQISNSIEDIGGIVWPLFTCNTLAWTATYICMSNGIKSIGKVVYFTATFPFLILLVLLLRGLTLPGAMDGVYFYIYPQWDQLTNFKVWCDAAVQIFFSLGPGWGGIINMASYNNFYNNNRMDSIVIPLCNSGTSIIAGFVVFSVLGFMSHKTGIPVSSVATGGPGLAFVTYPEAISLLPWSNLWAVLFFLMLFFLGLGSVFVTAEAIITSVSDEYPKLRKYSMAIGFLTCCTLWACSTIYTTNSGMYWLSLLDWYASSISVMLISFIEVVMVAWAYGVSKFIDDIQFMIKEKVSWFWFISWKFSAPIILVTMFIVTITHSREVTYNGQTYPQWAIDLGWTSCYISMACIPIYMGYHLLYLVDGDFFQRISTSLSPDQNWGPADQCTKLRWIREVKLRQIVDTCKEELDSINRESAQHTTSV